MKRRKKKSFEEARKALAEELKDLEYTEQHKGEPGWEMSEDEWKDIADWRAEVNKKLLQSN